MGVTDTSSTELALLKSWAKAHGYSLQLISGVSTETPVIEASAPIISAVAPSVTAGLMEKLVQGGKLERIENCFRATNGKDGFQELRKFAKSNGLLLNTQAVIMSITPA
jgi:hypothetical protein